MKFILIITDAFLFIIFLTFTLSQKSQNKINQTEIWNYFTTKYSTDRKNYLTPSEITRLVTQNQHSCNNNTCHKSPQSDDNIIIPPNSKDECQFPTSDTTDLSSCPQILYLIDNHICQSNSKSKQIGQKPPPAEVWGYGVLFVTIISCSSLAGVSVMPFMGKKLYKNILTVLIGLAVGSLTGSSVFHLIPQAYGLMKDSKSHSYLYTSLVVCGGIWMFFMVERFLKIIMEYKDRKDQQWKQSKNANIYASAPETTTVLMLVENGGSEKVRNGEMKSSFCSPTSTSMIHESQEMAIKASFGHQEKPRCSNGHEKLVKFEQGKDSVIATVAWMIIFGDGLHNFIDGLSIGAAFNGSILTGISISVAVLCEELPHELGDFAVLLNAGMSIRQALIYNFLSACTCYVGMAIGIFIGEVEASQYIFGLAGGMFLYIALVDMVPEMNEVSEESSKISVMEGLKVLFLQNIGMMIGITVLFTLAMYQESMQF